MRVSPYPASAWTPRLRLSLDDAAWAQVVAKAGGRGAILESPMYLDRAAWQYEAEFIRKLAVYGVDLRPGALYLGVLAGAVVVKLVNPGPVTWLQLPDLSQARLTALAAVLNALVP